MIGLIVAIFALLPLFVAIPMGIQVDRHGGRRFLMAGSIAMACSLAIVAVAPSYLGLILSQLGTGFSHIAVIVACQTIVSRQGGPMDREYTLGLFTTFNSGGNLIGPILGGFVADVAGFSSAFLMAAFFGLVSLALIQTLRPTAEGTAQRKERNAGGRVPILPLLRNSAMIVATVSAFAQIFALGAWEAFFPIWMQGNGHSITIIGIILSIQALVSLFTRTGLKFFARLIGGRFRLLVTGMFMGGIAVGILPLTSGIIQIGAVAIMSGISTGLVFPLGIIAVAVGTTDRERGLGMGIRLTGNRLASLTNPLLFGLIATAGGLPAAFFAGSAILLLVTAGMLPFSNAYPEEAAETSDSA